MFLKCLMNLKCLSRMKKIINIVDGDQQNYLSETIILGQCCTDEKCIEAILQDTSSLLGVHFDLKRTF